MHCHLRLPVSPVVLGFNHAAAPRTYNVPYTKFQQNRTIQSAAELLMIQQTFPARFSGRYSNEYFSELGIEVIINAANAFSDFTQTVLLLNNKSTLNATGVENRGKLSDFFTPLKIRKDAQTI